MSKMTSIERVLEFAREHNTKLAKANKIEDCIDALKRMDSGDIELVLAGNRCIRVSRLKVIAMLADEFRETGVLIGLDQEQAESMIKNRGIK